MQNVLHWHIVDEESFPLEIPSYPALWDGAYSSAERYTVDDAREIVEYVFLTFKRWESLDRALETRKMNLFAVDSFIFSHFLEE